ncbi:MAG: hypothetical protein IKB45_01555 [Clostridia bacterium]|nr:hypothetical protein [Clostridia bacterium]
MSEANFLTYKEKPLVRSGNVIYYGSMSDPYVIKLEILSSKKDGDNEVPDKIKVQLQKSDIQLSDKDRIVKETTKNSMFEALDFGLVWLERALKE